MALIKGKRARAPTTTPTPQGARASAPTPGKTAVADTLLAWYDANRRDLPWRYAPGETADPYRVWLSEIMLQQTVVKAVIPYFETFTARWPTVRDLAAAPLDDVLAAWAGLGYYSRARNLHAAARHIVEHHAGRFPGDEPALRNLPGVGPYTAAAIAAIAYDQPATPIDGNIERVTARVFAISEPLPRAKSAIKQAATTLTPAHRAGDFAQAMMDLGASICTPQAPACTLCPLQSHCRGFASGVAAMLPVKQAKAKRPDRFATAFLVTSADGYLLLRKRPPRGLLGGLYDLPSTAWTAQIPGHNTIAAARPLDASFTQLSTTVVHVFTHFRLELQIETATIKRRRDIPPLIWAPLDDLVHFALPTITTKVLHRAGITSLPRPTTSKPPRTLAPRRRAT